MISRLFLIFTLVPFLDLAILIKLGGYIGFWPTISIILLTGVLGAVMVKREGLSVIKKIKADLGQGVIPGRQLINGLLVLIGGILLITPGIITDTLGFVLLMPASRDRVQRWLITYLRKKVTLGYFR